MTRLTFKPYSGDWTPGKTTHVDVYMGRNFCGSINKDLVDEFKLTMKTIRKSKSLLANLQFYMSKHNDFWCPVTADKLLSWVRKHGSFDAELLDINAGQINWSPVLWSAVMSTPRKGL